MATTTLLGRQVRLRPSGRSASGRTTIDFERLRPWMGGPPEIRPGTDPGQSLPVVPAVRRRTHAAFLVVLAVSSLLWYYSFAVLVVSRGTPLLGGWDVSSVLTGSMYPALHPGDLVAYESATSSDLRPGRIVVFDDPVRLGGTVVHRIVEQRPDGTYVTKGDANQSADSTPVPGEAIRGVVTMVTPHGGLPTMWLAKSEWLPLVLLIMGLLFAAVMVHRDDASTSRPRFPTMEQARREAVKSLSRRAVRASLRARRARVDGPVFAVR